MSRRLQANYSENDFTVGKRYHIEVFLVSLTGVKEIKYDGTCQGVYDDSVYFDNLSNVSDDSSTESSNWVQEVERTGPSYTTYAYYKDITRAIEIT